MHIKTLTIQGFKSYRDQVAVEPFSPKHNVVVGRNGSGKSNFFLAIRFVLSDAYTSMQREERQSLLHEGTSNQTTMSAFVEIVFDNQDGRFPTSGAEVVLRRTIGSKKDEYSLDKKSASKAEVMNLLESAGFSRSNPYYIVPQGRITALTNMKEGERLNLLKEVAGTKVYEQRRQESLKIMEETETKRTKIVELLEKIEERLSELEEEKEELKDYQQQDRDRRCLEYALYSKELEDVEGALSTMEEDRRKDLDDSNEKRAQFNDRELQMKKLEGEVQESRHDLAALTVQSQQLHSDMTDLLKQRTELECLIQDLVQAGQDGESRRKGYQSDLKKLETKKTEVEKNLKNVEPLLEEKIRQEKELKASLDKAQARLESLYAKQGRSNKFKTKQERDAFLRNEIKSHTSAQEDSNNRVKDVTKQIASTREELDDVVSRRIDLEQKIDELRDNVAAISGKRETLKAQLDAKIEQRKELWREDGKLSSNVNTARAEKATADRSLAGMMDKDTNNGLQAVTRIAKSLKLDGVYGPLYSLFETDDKYKVAVEVTAGNSLFHVVVNNDETASKILAQLNKEKAGRVTFMPLNRLKTNTDNRPMPADQEAIPLKGRLRYDAKVEKAIDQVFGKTILCSTLTVAAAYTRSHGVSAITLDGDRVDKRGSLTGGYHNVKSSRLEIIKEVRKWTAKHDEDSTRLNEVKAGLVKVDQEINGVQAEIQKSETARKQAIDSRQPMLKQMEWIQKENQQFQDSLARLVASLAEAEQDSVNLQTKIDGLEAELSSPMTQTLTDAEIKLMADLTKQVDEQNRKLVTLAKERQDLSSQKQMLEIELNEDLKRRQEQLKSKIENAGLDGAGSQGDDPKARATELKALERSITDLQEEIDETEGEIERLSKSIADNSQKLEEIQTAQMENSRGILKTQKAAERYLSKKQTLSNRKDECNKSIRDLGVLPREAFEKYTSERSDKLVKLLHKVNDKLKAYAHVNKKAFEQYAAFDKQKESLLKRRDELDESGDSIQELITTLDMRKDEAIERTFKQVSKYFSEVFERLVPAGKGKLKMQKRIDQDEDDMDVDGGNQRSSIDSYTGVAIEVSFNSKSNEGLRIQQLSGGQKSLVALATVFAIQKCDPAPFYLFDEIDANLDAQYRTAIAGMIHELSETSQYITTTFRSEMLTHADKFYGVIFNNQKVSRIETIDQEQAQTFVDAAG